MLSDWVKEEVNTAVTLKYKKRIKDVIPFIAASCDPSSVPPIWDALQAYDATLDYDRALAGLLSAVGLHNGANRGTQPKNEPNLRETSSYGVTATAMDSDFGAVRQLVQTHTNTSSGMPVEPSDVALFANMKPAYPARDPKTSVICVVRPKAWFGMGRALKVQIDGTVVVSVKHNAVQEFRLNPGYHEVLVKMDWCKSPALVIATAEGNITTVEVKMPDFFSGILGPYFWPNRLFALRQR